MSANDLLKKKVEDCYGLVEFTYHGKYGNIDPCFHKDGTYIILTGLKKQCTLLLMS